jgi:hypothetical protein
VRRVLGCAVLIIVIAACSGGDFIRTEKRLPSFRIVDVALAASVDRAIQDEADRRAAIYAAAVEAALAEQERERIRGIEEARINEIWARWTAVGRCEQPGHGVGGVEWTVQSSTYSGGLGISNGAWRENGGLAIAPNAGLADPWSQMLIAENIMARHGRRAWGCPVP